MADRELTLKLGIDFTEGTKLQQSLRAVGEEASKQAQRVAQLKGAFKGLSAAGQSGAGGQRLSGMIEQHQVNAGAAVEEMGRLKAQESIAQSIRGQEQSLVHMKELLNPEMLKQRVGLALQQEEAQKHVVEALGKERTAQTGLTAGQRQSQEALERQKETLAALREHLAGMKPPPIPTAQQAPQLPTAAQVNLPQALPVAAGPSLADQVKLSLEIEDAHKKILDLTLQEREAQTGMNRAQENARDALEAQRKAIEGVRAALDPDVLRERVKLTIEESKAREVLAKATEKETKRQGGKSSVAGAAIQKVGSLVGLGGGSGQGAGAAEALKGLGTAALGAGAGLIALKSVALASPGTMERFQLALEDTAAVVGQTLTPVLEIMTEAVRLVGDVLASILPSAGDMREALAPIKDLFASVREAIAPLVPIIRDTLVVALKSLGVALNIVILPFRLLGTIISALFGESKLKSSVGAAARNLTFTTAEAGAKSVYSAAYKTSAGGEAAKDTPAWLETINKTLEDIGGFVKAIADKLGAVKEGASTGGRIALGVGTLGGSEVIRGGKNLLEGRAPWNPGKGGALGAGLGRESGKGFNPLKGLEETNKLLDAILRKETRPGEDPGEARKRAIRGF